MKDRSPPQFETEEIASAVRYLLQLAVERVVDGAEYQRGAWKLHRVVTELNRHSAERESLRRHARLAFKFNEIFEWTEEARRQEISAQDNIRRIWLFLRDIGIAKSQAYIGALLVAKVPNNGRDRTARERLAGRLASLIGKSQSKFEKSVSVATRNTRTPGKLSARHLLERAVADIPPPMPVLLMWALDIFDVDEATATAILAAFGIEESMDYFRGQKEATESFRKGEGRHERVVAIEGGVEDLPKVPAFRVGTSERSKRARRRPKA